MVTASIVNSAYHHMDENDSDKFLAVYPDKAGTKLDHCVLCHSGGQYEKKPGKWVTLGSCQWCHYSYGYDGSGNILDTMNQYGKDYHDNGRNSAAFSVIDNFDSDGDGFANKTEIEATRFPGDANDDPNKIVAPYRVYTRAQLEAMTQHTQFLLMNTSRSGDFYAEYSGVPVEDLLQDAGISDSATGIMAYAPDGWSNYHPLEADPDPELYHVNGVYPAAAFHYDPQADVSLGGWCDYSAPSCIGRNHNDPINVAGGLKMLLATRREGAYLTAGILDQENKLDGEGPFRIVPPQKTTSPPDQSSTSENQAVIWPYDYDWDHNAGAASRSVTIIKIEPLPPGTTDIDIMEAGWSYVDEAKIIIYGAIDPNDSNNNGILDSEEKGNDPTSDIDNDGIPDYQDPDTASFRHANGLQNLFIHTSKGAFSNAEAVNTDSDSLPGGKPVLNFLYGVTKFDITGLDPNHSNVLDPNQGESVTVKITFPNSIPSNAVYYKISASGGWHVIPFTKEGDKTVLIILTDGDPNTDADLKKNGKIVDPGGLAIPYEENALIIEEDDDSICFINGIRYFFYKSSKK